MDNSEEYALYRKKRIAKLKKIICIFIIVLILLPTVLCIILFIRLNRMQRQIDAVIQERQYEQATVAVAAIAPTGMDGALYNENIDSQSLKSAEDINHVPQTEPDEEKYPGKRVYLTFDDGPSDNTDLILDKLAQYGAKATFFVVQKEDEESLARYRRIIDEGHTLAIHSASHIYSAIYSSYDAYTADVTGLQNFLEEITGQKPKFYRFPGGSSNTVSAVPITDCIRFLEENNITYFDWNVASGDADSRVVSASVIAGNVIKGIDNFDSSVVLMHDAGLKTTTVDALDSILSYIADSGAVALPITEGTTPVHHKITE